MALQLQNVLPFLPPILWACPLGMYSISYDISTRATEDDLPDGWYSYRSTTYRQLRRLLVLAGFVRHQYSDWRCANAMPVLVWLLMVGLSSIDPPMKFATTVRSLKMHFIFSLQDMDVTNLIQLGGALYPALTAPTPAGLVLQLPPGLLNPPPVIPGPGFVRPQHTRISPAANNPPNWRT